MNALNDEVNNEILSAIQEDVANNASKDSLSPDMVTERFARVRKSANFPRCSETLGAAAAFARDCSNLLVYIDTMQKTGCRSGKRLGFRRRAGNCYSLP